MRKNSFIIFGFSILLLSNTLSANVCGCSTPESLIVEFRPSYYYPTSANLREIYPGARINYQITATQPLFLEQNSWMQGINLWAALDYFSKEGHSTALDNKTTIEIIPLTLGVKYFFPSLNWTTPANFYAAAGFKYYYVHTHNHGTNIEETINRSGLGGVIEAGLMITLYNQIIFDIFSSYSMKTFDAPSISTPSIEATKLNVSGFNVGIGLGYKF